MHFLYQEGRTVFKYAVSNMSDACVDIAARNNLTKDNIDWIIPHQAKDVYKRQSYNKLKVYIEPYG